METPSEQAEHEQARDESLAIGAPEFPSRDPFVRRVTTTVVLIVVAGLLLGLIVLGIQIVLAAFGGLLIAVFIRTLMALVQRFIPLPDGWAFALILILILTLTGLGFWLLAPQIAEQARQLGDQLATVAAEIENYLGKHWWGQWILDMVPAENGGLSRGVRNAIAEFFSGLSDWLTYLLTAVFVGLFGAADTRLYKDAIVHLFPLRQRPMIRELVEEAGYTLRWWLIGQVISMTIVGVSVSIMMWAFGLPLALVCGLLVGLLGFVPYLGAYLGAVPLALIATPEGSTQVLYVMGAYLGIQLVESYVGLPIIQHRTVYLPPALTIIAEILFGVVLGLLGFVLATPLAAVALVLIRFYRSRILGDPDAGPSLRARHESKSG